MWQPVQTPWIQMQSAVARILPWPSFFQENRSFPPGYTEGRILRNANKHPIEKTDVAQIKRLIERAYTQRRSSWRNNFQNPVCMLKDERCSFFTHYLRELFFIIAPPIKWTFYLQENWDLQDHIQVKPHYIHFGVLCLVILKLFFFFSGEHKFSLN